MVDNSATETKDIWKLREDLQFQWQSGVSGAAGYWVVNDPIARQNYWISELEKQLLTLADGVRDLSQLSRASLELIQPNPSTVSVIIEFFVQAKRTGLLRAVGAEGPLGRVARRTASPVMQQKWLGSPMRWLFYRFPGMHPNRLFGIPDRPSQETAGLAMATWITCGIWILLVAVAAVIVIGNFDQLATETARALQRRGPASWIWILVAIAGLKSIHELAHVFACRRFGAECRELGVMLLFGTPCLFCDVSDLWRVPATWKRVAVSAAGMLAELSVAATCAIVWSITSQSTLHELALLIMIVGSISTIVVNLNPLLRYDGYFILSDLIGTPNFGATANGYTLARLRSIIWGPDAPRPQVPSVGRRLGPTILILYSVSSAVYRFAIVGIISWTIYRVFADWGFDWLGLLICFGLPLGMIMTFARSLLASPVSTKVNEGSVERTRSPVWWKHPRAFGVLFGILLAALLLVAVPLPKTIRLPLVIAPSDAKAIYVNSSGVLQSWQPSGTSVDPGQALMTLTDDRLDDALAQSRSEVRQADASLRDWRRRRGASSGTAERIALASQRLKIAEAELDRTTEQVRKLELLSPTRGAWILDASAHAVQPGQWLEKGTLVGWVRDGRTPTVTAYASPSMVDAIRPGQKATIAHPSLPRNTVVGTVKRIASSPVSEMPMELLTSREPDFETETFYAIEIECEEDPILDLVIGSVAKAKVSVQPMSIYGRLDRMISESFRLGL